MPNEKPKKIKWALSLTVGAYLVLLGLVFATQSQNIKQSLHIDGSKLNIEIATSSQEKRKGLCCRKSLATDAGMLFVYNQPGDYHYWMKDTLIPLDMIWISADKRVVHIEPNVQPESYPKPYGSPTAAQYILETNAGWTANHNIQLGDQVSF